MKIISTHHAETQETLLRYGPLCNWNYANPACTPGERGLPRAQAAKRPGTGVTRVPPTGYPLVTDGTAPQPASRDILSPTRHWIARLVPVGTSAFHVAVPQLTGPLSSNAREAFAIGAARAPSTFGWPPLTVAFPPPVHGCVCQSAGRAAPESSALEAGERFTLPSPARDIAVCALSADPKSAPARRGQADG